MMVTSLLLVTAVALLLDTAASLGTMSTIAVSYGDKGSVFCGLSSTDGTHVAACYGANSAITLSTPPRLRFLSLTAGDGFVCGLLRRPTSLPFCWGASAYVPMGLLPSANHRYLEITAGDYHLCALREPSTGRRRTLSVVDCWGYNMTRTFTFDSPIHSLSAGSDFTCALFSANRTAFCWGDDSSSRVAALAPRSLSFRTISAGGYHVCGILDSPDSRAVCWGRSLDSDADFVSSSVDAPPPDPMFSLAGGKFHACGVRVSDRAVVCWGLVVKHATAVPAGLRAYEIAAGNYFTCGIIAGRSLLPVCWGSGFPASLPIAAGGGGGGDLCRSAPCTPGYYEQGRFASSDACRLCIPCSTADCPADTYLESECSAVSDRLCSYNCSACASRECSATCSASSAQRFWSVQVVVIAAEIAFAAILVVGVSLYIRWRVRGCRCDKKLSGSGGGVGNPMILSSSQRTMRGGRRAKLFAYDELERATSSFADESLVGKGSFSDVFRGVLDDGTVVAVKRAVKRWKEFQTELDLLSRLNHAHLLNLLGFCEQGDERLLVYEYMANGSLHNHLHGTVNKVPLDWVRRATIAVQAARGIEYLHGYACPPVIHRDIKSSNILIDEDHNARVADFGLSLLGPADSCSPLPELPAGTLGYLDPEYYRLHYLTTKSDVYSFGVLLLEILSGRKAIHMEGERAVNIVEWAVPLIKAGDVAAILDVGPAPAVAAEEALRRMANVACKCVRMRGKERPSMDKVTTALERALALLIEQPILPTEIVLGSTRLHNNKQSSDRITYPSLPSSHRRKSSSVDHDNDHDHDVEELGVSKEEICPAAGSPNHDLFLHHNF